MPQISEYNATSALRLLLDRVRASNAPLADRIQSAIDAGTDIEDEEPVRGKKRRRTFRKHVAYSPPEALQVAWKVLEAHFVVLPRLVNSAQAEFAAAKVAGARDASKPEGGIVQWYERDDTVPDLKGISKSIEIETETEATQIKQQARNFELTDFDDGQVDEMRMLLTKLKELFPDR